MRGIQNSGARVDKDALPQMEVLTHLHEEWPAHGGVCVRARDLAQQFLGPLLLRGREGIEFVYQVQGAGALILERGTPRLEPVPTGHIIQSVRVVRIRGVGFSLRAHAAPV